jgi:hypothetical protein
MISVIYGGNTSGKLRLTSDNNNRLTDSAFAELWSEKCCEKFRNHPQSYMPDTYLQYIWRWVSIYIAYCLHLNSNILDLLLHPFPKCFPSRKVLCLFIRRTNSCPRNKVLYKRKLSSVKCMQGTIVDGQCSLRRSDLFPPGLFPPRAGREYLLTRLVRIWTDRL